jgi:threonine dehydrogenase-like Zn-dependent dehydrogenase
VPLLQIKQQNAGAAPDVVIECSGHVKGLHSAIQTAGMAGTVIAAGFYAGSHEGLNLSEEFLHNRVTIKASMGVWGCPTRFPERWDRPRLMREALHLMEKRRLNLNGFISGRFAFTDAQRAYEAVRDHPSRYVKVVFTYDPSR